MIHAPNPPQVRGDSFIKGFIRDLKGFLYRNNINTKASLKGSLGVPLKGSLRGSFSGISKASFMGSLGVPLRGSVLYDTGSMQGLGWKVLVKGSCCREILKRLYEGSSRDPSRVLCGLL